MYVHKPANYAKIDILKVTSILPIASQVKHTGKHSNIDSKNKSVKQNADNQNHLMVCFYMFL